MLIQYIKKVEYQGISSSKLGNYFYNKNYKTETQLKKLKGLKMHNDIPHVYMKILLLLKVLKKFLSKYQLHLVEIEKYEKTCDCLQKIIDKL